MSNRKLQRKKKKIFITAGISLAAIIAGGYFLWSQIPNYKQPTAVNVDGKGMEAALINDLEYEGSLYQYNDHLTNHLFMGIDTRDTVDGYTSQNDAGQADSIFLVSMDRVTEEIKALVIPRDTIAEIEVFNPSGKSLGHTKDHINIQYAYGDGRQKSCQLMSTAVSKLLGGIPIHKYCSLNMDGIPILTEAVDGITVTVPNNSLEAQNPEFYEGAVVELTGENTEMFVRYRDTDQSGSAMVRQERQKIFLEAFAEKARQKAAQDSSFVIDLYEEVEPYTVTNMGNDLFAKLLTASGNTSAEVNTVPGEAVEGKSFDEYHVDEEKLTEILIEMFYRKLE